MVIGSVVAVVAPLVSKFSSCRRTLGDEYGRRGLVGIARVIAGRGKVRDPLRRGRIDRLGHDPVLEERLIRIAHIIDDDVRAQLLQLGDAGGEIRFGIRRRCETPAAAPGATA